MLFLTNEACGQGWNRYFVGSRYNRAWVPGRCIMGKKARGIQGRVFYVINYLGLWIDPVQGSVYFFQIIFTVQSTSFAYVKPLGDGLSIAGARSQGSYPDFLSDTDIIFLTGFLWHVFLAFVLVAPPLWGVAPLGYSYCFPISLRDVHISQFERY